MTITAITYPCNDDSFGKDGATEAEQAGYRAYLAGFLAREFPGADITIDGDDCARLIVETDGDPEDARLEVINAASRAWSECRWEWVADADNGAWDTVLRYVSTEYSYKDEDGKAQDPLTIVTIRPITADDAGDYDGLAKIGDWLLTDQTHGNVVRIIDGKVVSIWNNAGMPVAQPG